MRRRDFLSVLGIGAAVGLPLGSQAQPQRGRRVGILYPGIQASAPARISAFQSGLQAGGLPPEQIEIVPRVTGGNPALLPAMAADLVALKVDLIFGISPSAVRAARAATSSIPIVAGDLESDPIGGGSVASTTRPGGNVTGVFLDFPDFSKKWLEALKEAVPHAASVAVMWDPSTTANQLKAVEAAADALKIKLVVLEVHQLADIEPAFQLAVEKGAGALLLLSSPLLGSRTKLFAELALARRLPAITLFTDFARDGGLMAYGPNLSNFNRQAGVIAAKILLGANPAEMPIENPAKFEFVLNLKTAKLLGLTVPASILLRADEVIE